MAFHWPASVCDTGPCAPFTHDRRLYCKNPPAPDDGPPSKGQHGGQPGKISCGQALKAKPPFSSRKRPDANRGCLQRRGAAAILESSSTSAAGNLEGNDAQDGRHQARWHAMDKAALGEAFAGDIAQMAGQGARIDIHGGEPGSASS
jgi:hypothetical protein